MSIINIIPTPAGFRVVRGTFKIDTTTKDSADRIATALGDEAPLRYVMSLVN